MWTEPEGSNGHTGGSGICAIDEDDVRAHAERAGLSPEDTSDAEIRIEGAKERGVTVCQHWIRERSRRRVDTADEEDVLS